MNMCTSCSPPSSVVYKININHSHNLLVLGDSIDCYSFHNYYTLSDQIYALAASSVIEMTLMEKCLNGFSAIIKLNLTIKCSPHIVFRCLQVITGDYCMGYILRKLILQGVIQYRLSVCLSGSFQAASKAPKMASAKKIITMTEA